MLARNRYAMRQVKIRKTEKLKTRKYYLKVTKGLLTNIEFS